MGIFNTDGKILIVLFIGAIIAVTFMSPIGDIIFGTTNTITITNQTVTGATVNTTLDIRGREILTTVAIINETNATDSLVNEGGSLQTGTGSDGLLSVQLLLNDTAADFAGLGVNVSYTANPDGYISNSGGRSITQIILIIAALAIVVFTIVMFWKGGIQELFKTNFSKRSNSKRR